MFQSCIQRLKAGGERQQLNVATLKRRKRNKKKIISIKNAITSFVITNNVLNNDLTWNIHFIYASATAIKCQLQSFSFPHLFQLSFSFYSALWQSLAFSFLHQEEIGGWGTKIKQPKRVEKKISFNN